MARLAWILLKHAAQGDDLDACLRRWSGLVRHLEDSEQDAEAIARYALNASDVPREKLAHTLQELAGPRMREVVMTTGERLRQQGHQRGYQEGRKEGQQEGQQEMLLVFLRAAFGELDSAAEARVKAADRDQLETWVKRVPKASSLNEVFASE